MAYFEKGESSPESLFENRKNEAAKPSYQAGVNENGCLILPPEIARKLGLVPGANINIVPDHGRIEILPNIHSLARVYIEPTSRCNLSCQTCIRNTWKEPAGDMDLKIFEKAANELPRFPHLDSVMFGGFGEPTVHKDILYMIQSIKSLGFRAEMVTNGTLLDEGMLAGLMKSKLDSLWVSFDGTMETSFEDIREGAGFQKVVDSLKLLQKMNSRSPHKIEVGIAFVLMKKNINDLKNLDELARSVGAKKVSVSNVLPYSEEMEKEMLCLMTLTLDTFTFSPGKTEISLPRMDINNITKDTLFSLLKGYENLTLMGNRISADTRQCRFINDRCTFVRWDGKVSPCLGLLHSYKTFLNGFERTIESYTVGDMGLSQLWDIWNSKEYTKFREKVRAFDFSSCHLCGGCPSLEKNEEDCFGNTFPTCGGCLWAQGIIQCP